MKTTALITILLFQTLVFGQVIHHFENIDSKWNVAKTYPEGNQDNPNFVATRTSVYGYQGDSVIGGDTWNKMYVTSDSQFQTDLEFIGVTRVENDLVLFRDTLNQLDTLYNFNLNVGDSVLYDFSGGYSDWLEILEIDSVEINGSDYKRFHFEEPIMTTFGSLDEIWIEGIGSVHGPLFTRYEREFSGEMPDSMLLTCSYSSGQEVWNHPYYENCYVNIVLGLKKLNQNNFSIYPNPFKSEIYIDSKNSNIEEITIYNHLGKEIRKIIDYSINESIDLTSFDSGVYFIKIQADQNSTIKQVIKN